jgi:tetratricopeptide (TPR) repeat protein
MKSLLERLTRPANALPITRLPPFDSALLRARMALRNGDAAAAQSAAEEARGHARFPEQFVDADFERARAVIRRAPHDESRAVIDALAQRAHIERERAQVDLLLGEWFAVHGEPATARGYYEAAVRLTAQARAGAMLDVALLARGLLAEAVLLEGGARYAIHLLTEAIALLPSAHDSAAHPVDPGMDGWLHGLHGSALIASGDRAGGEIRLEAAVMLSGTANSHADTRRWLNALGESALARGARDRALLAYRRAIALPVTPGSDAGRAAALLGLSRVLLAESVLPDADGKPDENAVSTAREALDRATASGDAALIAAAHGALGEALHLSGAQHDALPHLRAALTGGEAPLSTQRVLAGALFADGAHDEALALYASATTDADRAAQHDTRRGGALLEAGLLRRDWGWAKRRMGDLQGAIALWMAALPLFENAETPAESARLYCDLAAARRETGAYARAVRDVESALMALNAVPAGDSETRGVVLANAAQVYAESSDVDSADAFFKEAIALAENDRDAVALAIRQGNYGWFLLMIGRPRRAQTMLEGALRLSTQHGLNPARALHTDTLGLVFDAVGDLPRALELHEAALPLTDDPAWRAHIAASTAHTLLSLGRADDALARLDACPPPEGALEQAITWQTARARVLRTLGRLDEARPIVEAALAGARRIDHRRLLADALAERSRLDAASGDHPAAATAWEEARKLYLLRHMPQGKLSPDWLKKAGEA